MSRLDELKAQAAMAREIDWTCPQCGGSGTYETSPGERGPCWMCPEGQIESERQQARFRWADMCPRRFTQYQVDTHPNRAAAEAVAEWIEDGFDRGRNLFLAGTVGSGKTGLAFGVLRELVLSVRVKSVKFGSVAALLEDMRPRENGAAPGTTGLSALQKSQVLLLDDLGVEKASEWQAERLYLIVNDRYERQLPTIMTTNMNRKQLEERVGERVMSRLMEDVQVVQMGGDDLRKRGA